VRIIEYNPEVGEGPRRSVGVAVAEPILLEAESEPLTETYLEIIDVESGNKVVTMIEVLSPTNKSPGAGLRDYRAKQREVCDSATSLVEIDLLRAGQHVLAIPLKRIPVEHRTPYLSCVRRAWVKGMAEVYPMPLAHPLPTIKVPLREDDDDGLLPLQPLIELCYRRGGYDGTIDYKKGPAVPFANGEAQWAHELLRAAGWRSGPPK
jgi:hypothetical protein